MYSVYELMISKWKCKKPHLVISITGDATETDISTQGSKFKYKWGQELRFLVNKTNSWVITAGTNAGVMKETGELISMPDYVLNTKNPYEAVVIGVAPWWRIQHRESIIEEAKRTNPKKIPLKYYYNLNKAAMPKRTLLNSNHSHFLLVDDHKGSWGSEVDFRNSFEGHLSTEEKIPVVCISIGGGPGTLQTLAGAITKKIPIILVKYSGRITKLFIDFIEKKLKPFDNREEFLNALKNLVNEDSKAYKFFTEKEEYWHHWKICQEMLNTDVFQIYNPKALNHVPLKSLIMRSLKGAAMSDGKLTGTEWRAILKLAVDLDEDKIGMEMLEKTNLPENLAESTLPIEVALDKNRIGFLKEFMKLGLELHTGNALDDHLVSGLNMARLYSKIRQPHLKKIFKIKKFGEFVPCYRIRKFYIKCLSLRNAEFTTFLPGYDCCDKCIEHGEGGVSKLGNNAKREEQLATVDDIFVWAVANIKTDVALALLPRAEYPLGCILFAICILNVLKVEIGVLNELYDNVEVAIEKFEKLSVLFINRCENINIHNTQLLLVRSIPKFAYQSPLILAKTAVNQSFIVTDACKQVIEGRWKGLFKTDVQGFQITSLIFTAPFVFLSKKWRENNIKTINDDPILNLKKKIEGYDLKEDKVFGYRESLLEFIKDCPINRMMLNLLNTVALIVIFVFQILQPNPPEIIFHVLFAFVLTLVVQEILEIAREFKMQSRNPLSEYLLDAWNLLDITAIFTYIIGYTFHQCGFNEGWCRLCFGLSLSAFILGLLQYLTVLIRVGHQIITIGKLLGELTTFLFILAFFHLAYSFGSFAMLRPSARADSNTVELLLMHPYFQMLGAIEVENIDKSDQSREYCYKNETMNAPEGCVIEQGEKAFPYILAIYVILTNILLLNLLIATFTYTFDKIQRTQKEVYYYGKFVTVMDYQNRGACLLVFSLFTFLYYLMSIKDNESIFNIRMKYKPKRSRGFFTWIRSSQNSDDVHLDTLASSVYGRSLSGYSNGQNQMTIEEKLHIEKENEIKRIDEQLSLWEDDVRDKLFIEKNGELS
ncbi:DgyrCDS8162 [Dimorphilus gyrociliatus]|nr:DgyrCDS8162 [Dimorphilus gyrociliatus]